jgi:hypothetical protein
MEEDLINRVFPHPTISEVMHEAVRDAYGRAIRACPGSQVVRSAHALVCPHRVVRFQC